MIDVPSCAVNRHRRGLRLTCFAMFEELCVLVDWRDGGIECLLWMRQKGGNMKICRI